MPGSKKLPSGSRADAEFAQEIAADPVRLQESYTYWVNQLKDLTGSEGLLEARDFQTFANDIPQRKLSIIFSERNYITSHADSGNMFIYATCLLSSSDIAKHLKLKSMWDAIATFEQAAQNSEEVLSLAPEEIASGIMATREYFDLVRRVVFCKLHAKRLQSSTAEILALYRREGAFVIPPPKSSYQHAPLILTGGPCRPENVTISRKGIARPSFNLIFPTISGLKAKDNSIAALRWNLLTTGGLDTIISPRSSVGDELKQIINKSVLWAFTQPHLLPNSTFKKELSGKYSKELGVGGKSMLFSIMEGLAKAELELAKEISSIREFLDRLTLKLNTLLDSHETESKEGTAFLLAQDHGDETFNCLEIMSDWFQSRKYLGTLLSYKDRNSMPGIDQVFSPFVTYLRYNLGDLLFIHSISVLLTSLGKLYATWPKSKRHKLNAAVGDHRLGFRQALEASKWFKDKNRRKELITDSRKAHEFWNTARKLKREKREELSWHFVGLAHLIKSKTSDENWHGILRLKHEDKNLHIAGKYAEKIIRPIAELGLVPAISIALEFLPIANLRKMGILPVPLAKSHSFEQLRLIYEKKLPKNYK